MNISSGAEVPESFTSLTAWQQETLVGVTAGFKMLRTPFKMYETRLVRGNAPVCGVEGAATEEKEPDPLFYALVVPLAQTGSDKLKSSEDEEFIGFLDV